MMTRPWQRVDVLSAAQRLEVLDLLNRTEVALSREALDESRRRAVVHGWRGMHWLLYESDKLVGYASASGDDVVNVEVAGGDFDADLLQKFSSVLPLLTGGHETARRASRTEKS